MGAMTSVLKELSMWLFSGLLNIYQQRNLPVKLLYLLFEPKGLLKLMAEPYTFRKDWADTKSDWEKWRQSIGIHLYSVTEVLSNAAVTMMYRSIKACVTMVWIPWLEKND